jgi:hypothetical protein
MGVVVYLGVAIVLTLDVVGFVWRRFRAIFGIGEAIKKVIIEG